MGIKRSVEQFRSAFLNLWRRKYVVVFRVKEPTWDANEALPLRIYPAEPFVPKERLVKIRLPTDQLIIFLIGVVLGFISLSLPPFNFWKLERWITQNQLSTAMGVTPAVVILGALASYWKRQAKRSYSIAEVTFGAVVSFNVVLHLAPTFDFSKLFAVGSAVYVIARGFNNLTDARKVPSSPPNATAGAAA